MKVSTCALMVVAAGSLAIGCNSLKQRDDGGAGVQLSADPEIAVFVDEIRAVDNHSHANSTAPADTDADALPLDGVAPFELPIRLRGDSPDWLAAYEAMYKYAHADLTDAHLAELRTTMASVRQEQGDRFPTWVLDKVGTEVLLANRIAMGPGLMPPRVRWVSYADALMYPLSTKGEAATTPDRIALFPLETKLLQRYLADLRVASLPDTLDAYLRTVVTPTLEAQFRDGCVAVKFEIAYLRAFGFDDVPAPEAGRVYAKYIHGGEPSHADYKALQDFLFRYIAREAGRLHMAVHIHSFEGAGNYFATAGADPLLLEPVVNDPSMRQTTFVIVHGGGIFAGHTQAMLWKPNVYADISLMSLAYTPANLAGVLRGWLSQFPERVLFGSDASAFGPDMGWELTAWIGGRNARAALAQALTQMMRSDEISRERAQEIATMVMRGNANTLYRLGLK